MKSDFFVKILNFTFILAVEGCMNNIGFYEVEKNKVDTTADNPLPVVSTELEDSINVSPFSLFTETQSLKPLLLVQPGLDCNLNLFDVFKAFLSEFAEIVLLSPSDPDCFDKTQAPFAYADAYEVKKNNIYKGYGNIDCRTDVAIKEFERFVSNSDVDIVNRILLLTGYSQGGPTVLKIYDLLKDKYNIQGIEIISSPINGAEVFNSIINPIQTVRVLNWFFYDSLAQFWDHSFIKPLLWIPSSLGALTLTTLYSFVVHPTNLYLRAQGYGFHEFFKKSAVVNDNYRILDILKEREISVLNVVSLLSNHQPLNIVNEQIGSLIQKAISGPNDLAYDEVLTEENQIINTEAYNNVRQIKIEARHGFNANNFESASLTLSHVGALLPIAFKLVCLQLTGQVSKNNLATFLKSDLFSQIVQEVDSPLSVLCKNKLLVESKKSIHNALTEYVKTSFQK